MRWLALAYALAQEPHESQQASSLLQTWSSTGRIVDETSWHLGLRPQVFVDHGLDEDWGCGLSVQLTVDAL